MREIMLKDFIIHFTGLICMIVFWIIMYKVCEKLKYFTEDDLFFNSKTLSFYCMCIPIGVAYVIGLILEFVELYKQ